MQAITEQFVDQIMHAADAGSAIRIIGGNSKAFLGNDTNGDPLETTAYRGIISYEPTELYITVRSGTPVSEVEQVLSQSRQMLAFEPPRHSEKTTIGGIIASGLSGPRRPYAGAARDFILGITCLNGKGQLLRFGGQVMKNVAGYDLSRLLTGSFGTLGVILDITLKVLPIPEHEMTCSMKTSFPQARQKLLDLSRETIPVTAAAYENETLRIRLSGKKALLDETTGSLGMQVDQDGHVFWQQLRDHQHGLFETAQDCWRLSLPVTAIPEFNDEAFILDWGGAQYWFASARSAEAIFQQAQELEGSATLFCNNSKQEACFQPLASAVYKLHEGLKQAFDPQRVFNPGKMYAGL